MRPRASAYRLRLLLRVLVIVALVLLAPMRGSAQPAPPPPPGPTDAPAAGETPATDAAPATEAPPAPPVDADAEKKEAAKQRFLKGLEHARSDDWDAALVEFHASREIFPTRVATLNAARALHTLKRYGEALDMYQELLEKFGAEGDERKNIEEIMARLRESVGELVLESDQPGTTVVVDGIERGATPLPKPVRVNAGTHSVRGFKEGFLPYEAQVMVAGGERKTLKATLKALTRSGRLRVAEAAGGDYEVVVDGAVVGKTPWEGPLGVGEHTVLLRGTEQMGTPPTLADVKENQVTQLNLKAVKLDATIRIEPTPSNARVALDGVTVGSGVWEGQVESGKRLVEVFAPGFIAFRREIAVESGRTEVVPVRLERNPDDPIWGGAFRAHVYAEAVLGAALAPSFGGSADAVCGDGGCTERSIPLGLMGGLRGGYALTSGLGIELFVGLLTLRETMTREQTATADPHVLSLQSTDYEDATRLTGPMAALSASYRFLEKTPITFRVWAGAARMKATFGNGGTFQGTARNANDPTQPGSFSVSVDLAEESPTLWVPFVGPEARFGLRLSDSFVLDFGVAGLVMFPSETPREAEGGGDRVYPIADSPGNYPDGTPIPQPGVVELPPEKGFGTMVAITPTIAARMDF